MCNLQNNSIQAGPWQTSCIPTWDQSVVPINRLSIFALFLFFPSSLSSSVFQISLSQSVSQSFPDSRPVEKLARASGFYFIPSLSSPFIVAPLLSLRSADNPPFLHRVDGKCRGASIRTPLPWHPLPLTYWLGTVLKDGHVSAIKEPGFTSPSGVPE